MPALPTRSVLQRLVTEIESGAMDPHDRIRDALARSDVDAALALVLAAGASGRHVPVGLAAKLVPYITEPDSLPLVVCACEGDRVPLLLDLVESGRGTRDFQAVALFLAAELLGESPPPQRLVGLVRTLARRRLSIRASILVALLARRLHDPHVSAVVGPWSEMADVPDAPRIRDGVVGPLRGRILDFLPESADREVVSGFTHKRSGPKAGRNDPCPCGSGQKYKKCCGSPARAGTIVIPSRQERQAALREASATITSDQVEALEPADRALLVPERMATRALVTLLQSAGFDRQWEVAEAAISALAGRKDLPGAGRADEYRADLITEALDAGALDVASRQAALLENPSELSAAERLALAFLRGDADLQAVERLARDSLAEDTGGQLVDLAFTLLTHLPALGIVFARAALRSDRNLDSHTLLVTVEEARDRLGLSPSDPAWEVWDQILGSRLQRRRRELAQGQRDDAQRELIERAESARDELQRASARIGELERELTARQQAIAGEAEVQRAAPPKQQEAPPRTEDDTTRLKQQVKRLEVLISEGNEQRRALRQELAGLSRQLELGREREPNRPSDLAVDPDEGGPSAIPSRAILVPSVEKRAAAALVELPRAIAREALALIASLAGGDQSAWRQTKKLEVAVPPTWSARVGVHYRLLFELSDGQLRVRDLIHRKELERTVRS